MSEIWPLERLSDYVDISIGGTPSRNSPSFWAEKPNGHPWMAISDLRSKFVSETREHISDRGVKNSNVKLIPAWSTVMSFKLSVGRAAITAVDTYSNEAIAAFLPRTKEVIDAAWLYHVLPRVAGSVVTDTAVKGATLNKAKMAEMTLRLPGYREQCAIRTVLDTLDTTIGQTEAIIAKLKQVKQGLLQDLLTRGIDANGELRLPQSQAPHLYKQSPLGWIPKEWDVELLDGVAVRGSGHTPSKSVRSYWDGGVKWVSLADSHRLDQIYIDDTDKQISDLGIANSSAVRHPTGTVILSRDAGIGKSAVLATEMAVSQHFIAWRCGERLNNLFLYFNLQRLKPTFEAIAMGSTIKTIGLPFFKRLQVAIPLRGEQDRAVEILLAAERHVASEKQELAKLSEQKHGLLDDLLTGRVRVARLLEAAIA